MKEELMTTLILGAAFSSASLLSPDRKPALTGHYPGAKKHRKSRNKKNRAAKAARKRNRK